MPANDYHFITHWFAPGATVEEVFAILSDVEALPHWWPSVYLKVIPVPNESTVDSVGQQFQLLTKGWLPYTLEWRLTVAAVNPPFGSTILANGDFEGRGIWSFTQTSEGVTITFDWKLMAEKSLLKTLSPVLKPAFAKNHQWAMEQGQVSLFREIERRRGKESLPPPPPTTWQPFAVLLGATTVLGVAVWVAQKRKR